MPKFRKAAYETVAEVISRGRIDATSAAINGEYGAYQALEQLAGDFACVFSADNNNFDKKRFLSACGFTRS